MQILYKEMIMTADIPWAFIITVAIIAVTLAILDEIFFNTDIITVLALFLGVILIFFGSGIIMAHNEYESGRYKYEVILDNDYPASDLYDKYNIIEQRGEIWVIEDKKPEFDKN